MMHASWLVLQGGRGGHMKRRDPCGIFSESPNDDISWTHTARFGRENLIFGRKKGSRRVRDHNEFVICYNVRYEISACRSINLIFAIPQHHVNAFSWNSAENSVAEWRLEAGE